MPVAKAIRYGWSNRGRAVSKTIAIGNLFGPEVSR